MGASPTASRRQGAARGQEAAEDLRYALDALRDATIALSEAPKKQAEEPRLGASMFLARRRAGARREREASLEGARHAVRRGGGVRVHAAAEHCVDAAEFSGRSRLAERESTSTTSIGGAIGPPAR